MSNFNYGNLTETTSSASAASATATASGITGKQIQVMGFSGSSNDQAITLELKIGSTVKLTLHGGQNTPTGHNVFGPEGGPVAATSEDVSVVTTPAATGQCDANLIYRIIS